MPEYLISVPIWGTPYVKTFCEYAAPALCEAARRLDEPGKFLIHTDHPEAISAALAGFDVETRSIPSKPTYVALQEGHADAVRSAAPGTRVVLLNADLVVSGNFLTSCAHHLDAGKQAVVLLGIRTNLGGWAPPAGADPRALLAQAWQNRHQIIRDLEWPHGGSMLPTNLFWSSGDSVVARGFHLHPAAIVRGESTDFHSTIDGDLLDCFPREAIHVVTSPDDCSMAELSDPARRFPVRGSNLTPQLVAGSMRTRASAMHRWLFTHRIVVVGRPGREIEDEIITKQVLHVLGDSTDAVRSAG